MAPNRLSAVTHSPMNGFYEWRARREGKQPYFIRPVDDEFLGVAGLWERWVRPTDGEESDTFTVVTTAANPMMASLHDRMPVILPVEVYRLWLDNQVPVAEVIEWVRPAEGSLLRHYPVGTQVGLRRPGPCSGGCNATSVQHGRGVHHQGWLEDP